jgi:general secretion pathway protein M
MMSLRKDKVPRSALFICFNLCVVTFAGLFVFMPLLLHFADRGEDISEHIAQLAQLRSLIRSSNGLKHNTPQAGDPFLPGNEERIVSADLQANLKTIGTTAGVRLLGIRSLEGKRPQQLHMVAVGIEFEGHISTVRDVIQRIENQTPMLFVTEASLRSATDGDDGIIRAELRVEGAVRESGSAPSAEEAVSQ